MRLKISFEATLATVSAVMRAIAHEITRPEALALRANVPAELRQLITESRAPNTGVGRRNSRLPIEYLSLTLNIDDREAKRRLLAVLSELRAHVTPWDDVVYLEFLDRAAAEIDAVPVEPHVA